MVDSDGSRLALDASMTLHRFDTGSHRKETEMLLAEGSRSFVPYRMGLSAKTVLPTAALDVAAIAITMGRSRHIEWSDSDDTLDRVLRYLKRDWEYRW